MIKYFFAVVFTSSVNKMFSQLAVRDEPRHHNVFENDYVRILDVNLTPGDTTFFHLHATPSVFIFFTKTITASELEGERASSSSSVPGTVLYDSLVTPRIHRVWNEDTGWFHVMDIELIAHLPRTSEPAVRHSSLELLFDKPLARGYKLKLTANEIFRLPSSKAGYLLLSMGNAEAGLQSGSGIQHRIMKAGHYCWIEANRPTSIKLMNTKEATFTLLQLK